MRRRRKKDPLQTPSDGEQLIASVARAYSRSLSAFPIKPEFAKARAHFVKIPNLEPSRVHTNGELPSVGA
jgi:hypothetical protein